MKMMPSDPVLTCAEAKAWESGLLKNETAEWPAMQEAGAKVAHSILGDFEEIGGMPARARLLVLAGKGHNGGDALLAAKVILERYPKGMADVLLCFGETALRPLARRSLDELGRTVGQRAGTRLVDRVSASELAGLLKQDYDLCLDGIFGFQFRPPMDDATVELIAQVNAHPRIKFRAAVDLPSGVGEVSAPTVFRADFTYATGIVKSPLVEPANAAVVGRLRYLDLGFFRGVDGAREPGQVPMTPAADRVLLPSLLAPLTGLRPSQSDKRTYGHLFVVGGSHSYPGAVVMAVRAALRSGTGLVTAFVPEKFAPEYASCHPEVMWVGCPATKTGGLAQGTIELLKERAPRATALLIGPGLGSDPETISVAGQIVQGATVSLVLDADALRPEVVGRARGRHFVVTPHAGEFSRIAGDASLRDYCAASGAVAVLKGPLTRIAEGSTTYYSPFGGPVLARGGSGDILAGLIGGLLAQQPETPVLVACRGVVWHGLAADLLARTCGQVTVETSQLLEQLGPALNPTS